MWWGENIMFFPPKYIPLSLIQGLGYESLVRKLKNISATTSASFLKTYFRILVIAVQ